MGSTLTPRQWQLYEYLKEHCDKWTHAVDIAAAVYGFNFSRNFLGSSEQRLLAADIQVLNKSPIIQKIVVSNNARGVKLASEEEAKRFIKNKRVSVLSELQRLSIIEKKMGRDKQTRIVFGNERPIVQAYIDDDKDIGERLKSARLTSRLTSRQVVEIMQADGFKIDAPLLSRYECGYAVPTKKQAVRMGEIYGVTAEYLLYGETVDNGESEAGSGLATSQKAVQ